MGEGKELNKKKKQMEGNGRREERGKMSVKQSGQRILWYLYCATYRADHIWTSMFAFPSYSV
jgi:hypothetical protein